MTVQIIEGDCLATLRTLSDESVQCCVTSPPYFALRDYGHAGQIGLEETPAAYVARLVEVFTEVRRVLRDDGTLWLNLGDGYGPKKQLRMIPARVALALQDCGWILRSDIIWHKPNPMPESTNDRPTSAHEHVFLLSKAERYFYDAKSIQEEAKHTGATGIAFGGKTGSQTGNATYSGKEYIGTGFRNCRNVWNIPGANYNGAHFATMPPELAERCIKAGTKPGDTVLDPFGGAGTTGLVADRLERNAILCELNPTYATLARNRIEVDGGLFAKVAT